MYDDNWKEWKSCRFEDDQDLEELDGKVVAVTIVACAALGLLLLLLVVGVWIE